MCGASHIRPVLCAGENFVGEAGGLFEEPPMPEVPPADGEQMSAVQKDDGTNTRPPLDGVRNVAGEN